MYNVRRLFALVDFLVAKSSIQLANSSASVHKVDGSSDSVTEREEETENEFFRVPVDRRFCPWSGGRVRWSPQ